MTDECQKQRYMTGKCHGALCRAAGARSGGNVTEAWTGHWPLHWPSGLAAVMGCKYVPDRMPDKSSGMDGKVYLPTGV